jgi:hypothetical protein
VTKIVLPVAAVVSSTATVGGLVWGADPEQLRKTNEARLDEIGVPRAAAGRFLVNGNYTLTTQTRLIAALHAVKAKGCADYVDTASDAVGEREALFFVESAELLARLHAREPVTAVLPDSGALVARTARSAVLLLPFDWVYWTEDLQKDGTESAQRAKQELGARRLEARLSGTATPAARAGLGAAGWTVKDRLGDTSRAPAAK